MFHAHILRLGRIPRMVVASVGALALSTSLVAAEEKRDPNGCPDHKVCFYSKTHYDGARTVKDNMNPGWHTTDIINGAISVKNRFGHRKVNVEGEFFTGCIRPNGEVPVPFGPLYNYNIGAAGSHC